MQQAYRYKDGQSDEFWRIEYSGKAFAVNYGKTGTTGKYQVKEFSSPEECEKEAEQQIESKIKKGYRPYPGFDPDNWLYINDEEFGPHPLTSHPRFRAHFTNDLYYSNNDEETPFGSDVGSETLAELEGFLKKTIWGPNDCRCPRCLIEDEWYMTYIKPLSIDPEEIKKIINGPDDDGVPIWQYVLMSDRVIIAHALGEIKIRGRVELPQRALRSMRRLLVLAELMGLEGREKTRKMIEDLESFKNQVQGPSEVARAIIEYLDCPCEHFAPVSDDDDIVFAYEEASKNGKKEGYTPLLVIVEEELLELITPFMEEDGTGLDKESLRDKRRESAEEAALIDAISILHRYIDGRDKNERPPIGKVEKGTPIDSANAFWSDDSDLTKEILLAKIPTRNPWELPIHVPMGDLGDSPSPLQQAAIMKYWYEKHGAVPFAVSHDEWQFKAGQPPADKDEALRLAMEHYGFCYNRVERSLDNTIGKLADCLMGSKVWYFRWS